MLGQTGTGKSTFINQVIQQGTSAASAREMTVGHNLAPCTESIEFASTEIDGHRLTMVDTPGFDESERDDSAILSLIAIWLKKAHLQEKLLSGVIYLHRISDRRMQGGSVRSLNILQRMCGARSYENISLATTMWDTVPLGDGEDRERQLSTRYWRPLIDGGGKVYRHDAQGKSARQIVRDMLPKPTVILQIQRELKLRDMLAETTAGAFVMEYLANKVRDIEENQFLALKRRIIQLEAEKDRKELSWKKAEEEKEALLGSLEKTKEKLKSTKDELNEATGTMSQLREDMARLSKRVEELEAPPPPHAAAANDLYFFNRVMGLLAGWKEV